MVFETSQIANSIGQSSKTDANPNQWRVIPSRSGDPRTTTDIAGRLHAPNQEHWRNLLIQTTAGSKRAYTQLLHEFDRWLTAYLTKIGFSGDKSMMAFEILQAVHDKLKTWDPSKSVLSWILAIADYKISSFEHANTRSTH